MQTEILRTWLLPRADHETLHLVFGLTPTSRLAAPHTLTAFSLEGLKSAKIREGT